MSYALLLGALLVGALAGFLLGVVYAHHVVEKSAQGGAQRVVKSEQDWMHGR